MAKTNEWEKIGDEWHGDFSDERRGGLPVHVSVWVNSVGHLTVSVDYRSVAIPMDVIRDLMEPMP